MLYYESPNLVPWNFWVGLKMVQVAGLTSSLPWAHHGLSCGPYHFGRWWRTCLQILGFSPDLHQIPLNVLPSLNVYSRLTLTGQVNFLRLSSKMIIWEDLKLKFGFVWLYHSWITWFFCIFSRFLQIFYFLTCFPKVFCKYLKFGFVWDHYSSMV